MTMTNELKPVNCGCGGEAEVYAWVSGSYSCHCLSCKIETTNCKTPEEAVTAWNKAMGAKDINVPDKERTAKVKRSTSMLELHQWDGTCEICGGHVYQDYVFCQYCGARLEWDE